MLIYMIRHGETDWNKQRRLQGQVDVPLNEYGISLAEITADALKDITFDKIFSSPLSRAYTTATIIANGRNIDIIKDSRLLELSFGKGEGESLSYIHSHPESNLYNFIHNPPAYIPPEGGENFESLYERCGSFLNELVIPMESSYKNILIVGHGALIRGMLHQMIHRDTSDFWCVTHKNCSVTILEYSNNSFKLLEEAKIFYEENIESNW